MKWKSPRCSAACWDEIKEHDAMLDKAITALVDMRRDRDEWKQQHENLLAMYRDAVAPHPQPSEPMMSETERLTHDELLILLIEECGEVIQAATKCLRFGWDVDHGIGYGNNRDQLAKELGELTAVRDELDINSGQPFMNGWKDKIKRAENAKAKFGRARDALSRAGDGT